jgi:hypothetical protein
VKGFIQLTDKIIQIRAKYGPVPASDLLSCVTTISQHLADTVSTEKDKVMEILKHMLTI